MVHLMFSCLRPRHVPGEDMSLDREVSQVGGLVLNGSLHVSRGDKSANGLIEATWEKVGCRSRATPNASLLHQPRINPSQLITMRFYPSS